MSVPQVQWKSIDLTCFRPSINFVSSLIPFCRGPTSYNNTRPVTDTYTLRTYIHLIPAKDRFDTSAFPSHCRNHVGQHHIVPTVFISLLGQHVTAQPLGLSINPTTGMPFGSIQPVSQQAYHRLQPYVACRGSCSELHQGLSDRHIRQQLQDAPA